MRDRPLPVRRNPYPGTREFDAGEQEYFFGRRQETEILTALVLARRASLLFAQSGAGKSSLIHAGLIPELTRSEEVGQSRRQRRVQKMHFLPVAGVGGGIPPQLSRPPDNVFAFSALHSLFPEAMPDDLAGSRLAGGIAPLVGAAGTEPVLLVFDQFEELFTHNAERWRERLPFFEQVAEALAEHPGLHVLFSMREDFIAELTPFADLLPGGLRDRFRLERLRPRPALEAVRGPAERAGLPFAAGVAEELVDNLRRAQAGRRHASARQDGAGTTATATEPALSEFVEPVHLQIVCRQLWDGLGEDKSAIERGDLQRFGDVGQALRGFYTDGLRRVLERTTVPEHRLRSWFEDTTLITPARTRGLVYRGTETTDGLPNAAVDELVDAYLIRSTRRGSDTWYELAHDRLVEPILTDNRQWRAAHLKPVTVAAEAWAAADKDPRKLYSGALLAEARGDAENRPAELWPLEMEFLDASSKRERAIVRRRLWQLTIATGVAAALALLAILFYRQRNVAISRELAASSIGQLATDPELSLLLALEAVKRHRTEEADSALRRALLEPQILREWADEGAPPVEERFSPGGRLVATRKGEEIVIRETISGEVRWQQPADQLIWSPDGNHLAIRGQTSVEVWDSATWQPAAGRLGAGDEETLLALGPGGERVALRLGEDQVEVRDLESGERLLGPLDLPLTPDVSFSPSGELLVITALDRVRTFAIGAEPDSLPQCTIDGGLRDDFGLRDDGFKSAAISRDGLVVTGGVNGIVRTLGAGKDCDAAQLEIKAHENQVNSAAFSSDGDLLLTASSDQTAAVWTARSGRLLARLRGHGERILTAAFGPEPGLILTSSPRTARLWRVALPRVLHLGGAEDEPRIHRAALSPEGRRMVIATRPKLPGADRRTYHARVWETKTLEEIAERDTGRDRISTVVFSPNDTSGNWVAIAAGKQILGISLEGLPERVLTGHEGEVRDIVFSADGERLLSTGDETVRLWDWRSGQQLKSFPRAHGTTAALSPDAERVVTTEGSAAKILSVAESGDPGPPVLLKHPARVKGAAFDSSGHHVVTACKDGSVRLWQTDGKLLDKRNLSEQPLDEASFGPDGRSVAVLGPGQIAYLWRPLDDSPTVGFQGDDNPLTAFFSRDGRLVLTQDGTRAQAWDARSLVGRRIAELPLDPIGAAPTHPKALSWSTEGLTLAVAWNDRGEIYDCQVCRPFDEVIELARQRVRQRQPERPLTPEERRRYLRER